MNFLRKWVLHNWTLKLLALVASFLIWTAYTSEPFVEVGYTVQLEYLNIPTELTLAGDLPTHARVYVRGRATVLRRLNPTDLAVTLDLSGSAPGEVLARISARNIELPPGLEFVRISPSEIRVQLAERLPR